LAHNLLSTEPCGKQTSKCVEVPYEAVKGTSGMRVKNIFFMPYKQQDVGFCVRMS
jgi:hypothetical protein